MSALSPPLLMLRADAGGMRGSGHVMRCLALARAWIGAGGRATLLSAGIPPALAQRAAGWGVAVRAIEAETASPADAQATAALAKGAACLVVDGYDFTVDYLRAVRGSAALLCVIDDVAALDAYPCDAIVNQNAHADPVAYAGKAEGAQLLLGGRYALLRPEFAVPPSVARTGVFATFGGVDPHGASAVFLAACGLLRDRGPMSLAIGAANPHADDLALAALRSGVAALRDVRDMAAAFAGAEIVVTAGGSTLWEACACAAPMVVLAVTAEEAASAEALAARGGCLYLGPLAQVTPAAIAAAVEGLARDPERRAALGAAARAVVDGRGADRVARVLMGVDATPI